MLGLLQLPRPIVGLGTLSSKASHLGMGMGKILASIGAILTICALAACGSVAGKSHAAASSSHATTAAPSTPASSAPQLTRRERRFVADMRNTYNWGSSTADQDS